MKRFTIAAIAIVVLVFTTMGLASNKPQVDICHYYQRFPLFSAFVTIDCMNWRLEEIEQRLEALEADKLLLAAVANLEAQKAGLQSTIGAMSAVLGQAQNELSRVLSATSNINTAVGIFTSHRYDSYSMSPTVTPNDLVWLHNPIPGYPLSISVGDVIGSVEPGCTVAHRVTAVVAGGYMVSGDNRDSTCFVSDAKVIYKWVSIAKNVFW